MADLVNPETKIRKGRLIRVKNLKRPKLTNQLPEVMALWLEDSKGENEFCIQMTDKELKIVEDRSLRNKEDDLHRGYAEEHEIRLEDGYAVKGRVFKVYNKMRKTNRELTYFYSVLVENEDESNLRTLKFSKREMKAFLTRANKNPEDIPKKPFFIDLLD